MLGKACTKGYKIFIFGHIGQSHDKIVSFNKNKKKLTEVEIDYLLKKITKIPACFNNGNEYASDVYINGCGANTAVQEVVREMKSCTTKTDIYRGKFHIYAQNSFCLN